MTDQIGDTVIYQAEDYALTSSNGAGLFEPAQLGLKVVSTSTANHRAFHCIYSVIDDALYLTTLYLGLQLADVKAMEQGEREPIFGKIPYRYAVEALKMSLKTGEVAESIDESPDYKVDEIQAHIPYSGGLLIGRGFIREMYTHGGFQAPYKYEVLHELVFEDGQLTKAFNRSAEAAEFRSTMLNRPRLDDQKADWAVVEKWVRRRFTRMYGRFLT